MKNQEQEHEIFSLGQYLKVYRTQKNLSITNLSKLTRIRAEVLENLEKDKFEKLPSRTYLVGFLRSICSVTGAEVDFALQLLNATDTRSGQSATAALLSKQVGRWKKKNHKNLYIGLFILLALVAIIYGLDRNHSNIRQYTQLQQKNFKTATPEKVEQPKVVVQEKNKITIKARRGDSWIAFKVDEKPVVRFILKKGKELELEGKNIRLTVGNATAVEAFENLKEVSINEFLKGSTAYLVFPAELREIYKPPFFVFSEQDGSALTKKQFDQIKKEI